MVTKYINFKKEYNEEEIKLVAEEIKTGNLVIFPTETVYGIGANAFNEEACKNIFKAKGRANDNPLIVHVNNEDMIKLVAKEPNELENKLIKEFCPGPFTIILKAKNSIPNIVTAGLDTVGIRMPSNKIANKLIEYANLPIAAPSANASGKPSGTKIEDIKKEFEGIISDIDNTLVPHGAPATEEIVALFDKIHKLGIDTCLISNNQEQRVEPFAYAVKSKYIFDAHKPSTKN